MTADVIMFPAPAVQVETTSSGGDFTVEITVTGSEPYPLKGGQGDYVPGKALLTWDTADGVTWTFREATLVGMRVGESCLYPASQKIYLGDPGYPDCEPVWLAAIVDRFAPGKVPA